MHRLPRSPHRSQVQANRRPVRIFLAICLGLAGTADAADMLPGNLVVNRIGNGTTALSNAAFEVSILEYSTSGSLVQTITSPFTGSNQLTDSGTATSNGYINTYNGLLAVPGLNQPLGTPTAAGTNAKASNILGVDGEVAGRALFPTGGPSGTPPSPFSGSNFRSVIATSANTFYATGTSGGTPATGGAWYYDGADFVQISATQNNLRNVEIYGGQLYVSSGAAGFLGVSSVGSGLPTTTGQTTTVRIATGTGSSPYGFVLFDKDGNGSADLAYIADERSSTGGGIQRWDLDGSEVWVNTYSLLLNTTNGELTPTSATGTVGIRGLTGSWDSQSGTATLFATTIETSNNRLVSLTDAGTTPTSFTTLAQAGTNYAFRGVDFTPVPEPSTYVMAGLASGLLAIASRRRRK